MAATMSASNIDSLRQAAKALPNDTTSVITFLKWSQTMRGENIEVAEEFALDGFRMAQSLDSDKFMGETKCSVGVIYSIRNDYDAALKNYLEAEKHFRAAEFEAGIAKCHLNMGAVYLARYNYDIAKKHLLEAKEIADRLGLEKYKININTNLAIVLTEEKHFEEALALHLANLVIHKQGDNLSQLSNTYTNIGYIYEVQDRHGEAYEYFKLGYDKAMEAPDGKYYEGGYALQNMVTALTKMGRLREAQVDLEKLWPIARQSGSTLLIADTYRASSELYKGLGNYKHALEDFERYRVIKDSLVNEDQNAKMATMQKEYDILKRDATIARIEQESAIIKAAQIRQQKDNNRQFLFLIVLALLGAALLIAVVIMVFVAISRKRALGRLRGNQKLIEDQNREIELQNLALKLQNERLEDLNREKDGLVGIVAHDLKSPMNKALALSELLKLQGELNEDQQRSVEMMGKVASAGNDLIRDLLDLNAIEHPDADLRPEHVDVALLLHELEMGFEGEAQRKSITMNVVVARDLPTVVCDRKALVRVLDNILSNAFKFSPKQRSIQVQVSGEDKDTIRLQITDEGPGISVADQEKMFKKFQRLSARPTGGENSTGLGLAITQALVQKLDGEIWLESTLGKGTTFFVRIPIAPPMPL